MDHDGQTVALIGGGRWGRVHASNLSKLLTPRDRVVWVSHHNQDAARDTIEKFQAGSSPIFALSETIDQALSERPTSALVVTSADTHFRITEKCLLAGLHVFVEKPLAFHVREATSLVDLAAESGRLLAVGQHLLSATYMHHFKSHLVGKTISRIKIRWFDPAFELRYGEVKQVNPSTPLWHDLYPHIWSIVRILTGIGDQRIESASIETAHSIAFRSAAGDMVIDVCCGRSAPLRERKIDIRFQDGGTASLDFTQEPGYARFNDEMLRPDPEWGHSLPPVMAEVQEFLKFVETRHDEVSSWPHIAANCIGSVAGAEMLAEILA